MAADDRNEASEVLEGTVERVVFHAPESGYTVARLSRRGQEAVTVVGHGGAVEEGAEVHLVGGWTTHPTYGRQFRYRTAVVRPPRTLGQIERRLQRYPGVGPAVAKRIVARFGHDTLTVLEREPRRLEEVRGLGPKTVERIAAHHRTQTGPKAAIEARLAELGISTRFAAPIHRAFGDEALAVLQADPYRLARRIEGIGFQTADRIARSQGIESDHPSRIEAGLLYVLERAEGDGHCALPVARLLADAQALLSVEVDALEEGFGRLVQTGDVVIEGDLGGSEPLVFRFAMLRAERGVAEALARLSEEPAKRWKKIRLPDTLSAGQRAAVEAVSEHRVTVLTGGPGTGKSTVVRSILEVAHANEVDVLLCAPTGRAAKRLEAATGQAASTIHRLLAIDPATGRFRHGPDDPLPPGLVVVDEASMLDVHLARALFEALDERHRLLLVGDADQLPSVGPGNVLRDVLDAAQRAPERIRVVALREVFRQAEGSSIVENAHRILRGERPVSDDARAAGRRGQFFVVTARSPEQVRDHIVRAVTERIPSAYGFDPKTEIQVLVPMHRGAVGTRHLNEALQARLGQSGPAVRPAGGARTFRLGDRVLQTRNDYTKGVFNGDVGTVVAADAAGGAFVVEFDGVRVPYEATDLSALQLAYAMTIHKSQGSEFPAVVIGLAADHHVMLRRNLIYTAVTRARSLCVVVTQPRALDRAVARADAARRYTGLRARLLRALAGGVHVVRVP